MKNPAVKYQDKKIEVSEFFVTDTGFLYKGYCLAMENVPFEVAYYHALENGKRFVISYTILGTTRSEIINPKAKRGVLDLNIDRAIKMYGGNDFKVTIDRNNVHVFCNDLIRN